MNSPLLTTVICGSYRKHWEDILRIRNFLEQQGVYILSPLGTKIVNPGEEFARLEGDPDVDVRTVQDAIFAHIRQSTFVIVANVNGYLGKATVFEMGYAAANGIRILTVEPVQDPNLASYTQPLTALFPTWTSEWD
ncbi:nucleoside 2-deoxyribosyltransferase [Desmospora activa]|uniref:Nucleoside 2-deoxyribosyltransferase-like protein n=1 Tax=Desmospora activa DSM 45169 TaxID=1121389 RepID=A0A2T4Z727_9BACL|nr:nucleoside 2-deoxyribosyltransferase [Desmospora activa]PTM57702.1 hypothetical protein C8J48_0253 [Desmospora activa DSM 45169]